MDDVTKELIRKITVQTKTLVDQTTTADTIYIGEALPGSATSAAKWRIQRVRTATTPVDVLYADGDEHFDNVWDDRASLSYS